MDTTKNGLMLAGVHYEITEEGLWDVLNISQKYMVIKRTLVEPSPIELLEWCIEDLEKEEEIEIDNFHKKGYDDSYTLDEWINSQCYSYQLMNNVDNPDHYTTLKNLKAKLEILKLMGEK
jgi:hypothetical protein